MHTTQNSEYWVINKKETQENSNNSSIYGKRHKNILLNPKDTSQLTILSAHSKYMHNHSNAMTQDGNGDCKNPMCKGEMVSHKFG